MPQLKTESSPDSSMNTGSALRKSTDYDTKDLINKMMEYEAAALEPGISSARRRFEMLTASERQFYRAELIADYIRLSAGNMGSTKGYYDAALDGFCCKICEMSIPSHELIGTYLAAMDIVSKDESLVNVPDLADAICCTMIAVLQGCIDRMRNQTKAV